MAAGYDAVVAYRWHPWFERTARVHEVLDRRGEVSARCSCPGRSANGIQELPLWMLDAGTCETMRTTAARETSASALADRQALVSTALAGAANAHEASEGKGVGFCDHHDGDRHAEPLTPPPPQLELFEKDALPLPPGIPAWTALPLRTQSALTGLVTRMLIAHASVPTLAPEDDDDEL